MNTDIVLPPSLDALNGPRTGVVVLPNYLSWSGDPSYDLSSPRRVETLYTTVLREALTVSDLEHLNKQTLLSMWKRMNLPVKVRSAWEAHFVELEG